MRGTVGLGVGILLAWCAAEALGQDAPGAPVFQRRAEPRRPPAVGLRPEQPPAPPFELTPEQQAQIDRILVAWERNTSGVRTFECRFVRFQYDEVFHAAGRPMFEDQGEIKYAAPDKALFRVVGERPEQWICDGRSIFQYDYSKKQVIEYKLPPEMQGSAIADGPIPFLFGAKAESLKRRYFLRVIPEYSQGNHEVWIQAYPRRQAEAANFHHAEIILSLQTMLPTAMQLHQNNDSKSRTVYKFESARVNPLDPLRHLDALNLFGGDPFRPTLPGRDWTRVVEEPPAREAAPPTTPPGWR